MNLNEHPTKDWKAEYEKLRDTYHYLLKKLERYKDVLENIAHDYPELSQDKARIQNLDHIKWAKEVLK